MKKGISLIILIITIIVILILAGAVILSLSQNNPINSAKEANFKAGVDQYNSQLTLYLANQYAANRNFDSTKVNYLPWDGVSSTTNTIKELIPTISNEDSAKYAVSSGKLVYVGTDSTEASMAKQGNIKDSKYSDYVTNFGTTGVNKPKLVSGMTPVYWNGSSWVSTVETDTNWYDYSSTVRKWANVQTADGSMWVWIPRYIYKISSGWHTATAGTIEVQFSKGTNDNWNSLSIGNISTDTTSNASNNKWTNHPGFSFGNVELTGIWVAKFESSNSGGKVKSVPNVTSWRSLTANDMFNYCRSMETDNTYGWGTTGAGFDTHMMKNVEWGVAAYLSKSSYGNPTEVWVNPDSNFITGRAGTSVSAVTTSTTNSYETANGVNASTTGTIYGIYDMSGGAWEYVAAYTNNGYPSLKLYCNSIYTAPNEYKDVYDTTVNIGTFINKKGDAVYETCTGWGTTAWFSDSSQYPATDYVLFNRGSYYHNGFAETAGGVFSYNDDWGTPISDTSFRPIIAVLD